MVKPNLISNLYLRYHFGEYKSFVPHFVFHFMFYQSQFVLCLFFSILNFSYFIRKVKQIHDKLWLVEYKVEHKNDTEDLYSILACSFISNGEIVSHLTLFLFLFLFLCLISPLLSSFFFMSIKVRPYLFNNFLQFFKQF